MYAEAQMKQDRAAMGAVLGASVAQRQLEVPAAVDRLERRVAALSEAVSALDQRLTGYVARPEAPQPTSVAGQQLKGAMNTNLGGQIDGMADAIEVTTCRLHSLMERLEA